MTWHVDPGTTARYLAGALPEAAAASVEAHLLECGSCRAALVTGVSPAERAAHDRTWAAIDRSVDAEPTSAAERLLGRLLPSHVVRLLAAAR